MEERTALPSFHICIIIWSFHQFAESLKLASTHQRNQRPEQAFITSSQEMIDEFRGGRTTLYHEEYSRSYPSIYSPPLWDVRVSHAYI